MSRIIPYLEIEKITMHGYGLGYADGKAVFVPFTIPGDCVNVKVRLEKKDVIFGMADEFIHTSPTGIIPQCEAFGGENACGGCDWLMVPYELQLKWKTELIRQVFEPLGLAEIVEDIIPSDRDIHYRNKSFLPAGNSNNGLYFGIYERYSHNVVPHKKCLLQPVVIDEILKSVEDFAHTVKLEPYNEITYKGILRHAGVRINESGSEAILILVTRSGKFPFSGQFVRMIKDKFPFVQGIVQNINRSISNVILGEEEKILYGSPCLNDEINGVRFRIHYKSFFQINHSVTSKLYQILRKELTKEDIVLDAYSGIGTISLSVAGSVNEVHGVEEVAEAVDDAEHNKIINKFNNAWFHLGKVEEMLSNLIQKTSFTAVIFDPPRKGLDLGTLELIAQHKIGKVLYVSCNSMTLARDVKIMQNFGYVIEKILPFDMFPQTWHIETLVKLRYDEN